MIILKLQIRPAHNAAIPLDMLYAAVFRCIGNIIQWGIFQFVFMNIFPYIVISPHTYRRNVIKCSVLDMRSVALKDMSSCGYARHTAMTLGSHKPLENHIYIKLCLHSFGRLFFQQLATML